MDIFKTTENASRSEIINREVSNIIQENSSTLEMIKDKCTNAFALVWNNPHVTPQEVSTKFGHDAYKLFEVAGLTIQYILALDPTWTPPTPPYEYTINEDGTVLVGEKIEE